MSTFPVGIVGVCFSHFFMCFAGGELALVCIGGVSARQEESTIYYYIHVSCTVHAVLYNKKAPKSSYLLKLYFVDTNLQCTGKNLIYLI